MQGTCHEVNLVAFIEPILKEKAVGMENVKRIRMCIQPLLIRLSEVA